MNKQNVYFFVFFCSVLLFSCGQGSSSQPSTTPKTNKEAPKKETTATNTPTPKKGKTAEETERVDDFIGDCAYFTYVGTALITKVTDAPEDGDNCPDAVGVLFDFTPVNGGDTKRYKYNLFKDNNQFMTLANGMNPSKGWITRNGVKEGMVFKCQRKEAVKKECTPVLFLFPELDMDPEVPCK